MSVFRTILFVGLGSFIGGVLRYLVYLGAQALDWTSAWATFTVNLVGCLVLGFVCGLVDNGAPISDNRRLFLTFGICGGFTTYSTFANDSFKLLRCGQWGPGLLYAAGTLVAGVLLIWAGYALATAIKKSA